MKIIPATLCKKHNNMVIDNPDYYLLPCGRYLEDFIAWRCLSFALGSALKYFWRAGKKFGESKEKDMKKCMHYVTFLAERTSPYGTVYWKLKVEELYSEALSWDGK